MSKLPNDFLARIVADLAKIPRSESEQTIPHEIIEDISAGRSRAVEIISAAGRIGTLVYRVQGRTLWVDAVYCASSGGPDLTEFSAKLAAEIAQDFNCKEIKCDTRRAGLVLKLLALSWEVSVISLTKKLS